MNRLAVILVTLVLAAGCSSKPKPLPPLKLYEVKMANGTVLCVEARDVSHYGGSQGRGDHYDFHLYPWQDKRRGDPVAVVSIDKMLGFQEVRTCEATPGQ